MKKISPVLALLLAAFATSASAAEAPATGFYAGASLGVPRIDLGDTQNSQYLAYSLLGGYQFMEHVAAEVQYSQLGSIKAKSGSVVVSAYNVALIGSYPLNEKFSALARLGYGNTNLATNDPDGANKKQTSVTYGIGAQYRIDARVAVRVTYDAYTIGDSTIPNGTTNVLSVGGLYSF